jgi:hypothetical protein
MHLEEFDFIADRSDAGVTPPEAACIDALFDQINYARSIERFWIYLLKVIEHQ